jgi:hypothetical protein
MKDFVTRFELPIRVNAETNARTCWRKRARTSREQRQVAKMATSSNMWSAWVISEEGFDVCVRFTRHGKRTLDDDNLPTAFKHIRDGVADAIGIDDGSARYTWEYAQVKSKEYKIEIEIEIGVRAHKRK